MKIPLSSNKAYMAQFVRSNHDKSGLLLSVVYYQQGEEKTATTKKTGLREKNRMTMKEKRFSFLPTSKKYKRKAELY